MFRFRIRLRLPRNLPHACARGDDARGHVHARGHGLRRVRVHALRAHARLLQLHLLPDVCTSRQRHKLFQSRMNVSKEFLQHQPCHGQFR